MCKFVLIVSIMINSLKVSVSCWCVVSFAVSCKSRAPPVRMAFHYRLKSFTGGSG